MDPIDSILATLPTPVLKWGGVIILLICLVGIVYFNFTR